METYRVGLLSFVFFCRKWDVQRQTVKEADGDVMEYNIKYFNEPSNAVETFRNKNDKIILKEATIKLALSI